jgi:hypothetical protein
MSVIDRSGGFIQVMARLAISLYRTGVSPKIRSIGALRNSAVAIDVVALLLGFNVGGMTAVVPGRGKNNIGIAVSVGRGIYGKFICQRIHSISLMTIETFVSHANVVIMPFVSRRKRMAASTICLRYHERWLGRSAVLFCATECYQ